MGTQSQLLSAAGLDSLYAGDVVMLGISEDRDMMRID
jgi:hypothetical protein